MTFNEQLQVGTILVSEWGYSMQMVTFYKVISRTKETVTLIELESIEVSDGGFLTGKATPSNRIAQQQRNGVIEPVQPDRRRIKSNRNYIKVGHARYAEIWDGKPKPFNHCD